jgi:hypothetical protein
MDHLISFPEMCVGSTFGLNRIHVTYLAEHSNSQRQSPADTLLPLYDTVRMCKAISWSVHPASVLTFLILISNKILTFNFISVLILKTNLIVTVNKYEIIF